MKRIFLTWFALLIGIYVIADEVSFTASAPDAVAMGDQFRVSYTITTQNVKDFNAPTFKGFEVLYGPSRSQQQSVQIINGKTTSANSITFTYTLLANTEGNFTIQGATIHANGNQMISNALHIKVLPADKTNNNSSSNAASTSQNISNNDVFVRAIASKTSVYEQEAFLLTYKIYTVVDLRGFENIKLPDFKGFHSQEVELPNDRKWGLEHYKGRNYRTTIYRQFVLFPQQSGKLTIDAARFDASIAMMTHVADPFEAFFNGGSNYVEVKKSLFTPKLSIEVKSLPSNKPNDFCGGVGEFNVSSSISNSNIKTNDAVTLKIVISGVGNLKLISNPEVKFPEDFEVYDPKVDNKSRLTEAGLSGSKVIEYLAIPRTAGTYKIPSINFSYFDIKSQSYKTIKTEEYELQVEKGEGNATQMISDFTNKEDLKVLNKDIRFIKQNDVTFTPKGQFFFGSLTYWLFYIIPLCLVILLGTIYYRRIVSNANVLAVRIKKANKIATKRLKLAGKLLSESKQEEFYDEILKALWGYVSDKLSIPISRLSKDNVKEALCKYGVSNELADQFLKVLNDCEFARFAPGNDNQAMDKIYSSALLIISKIENSIKSK